MRYYSIVIKTDSQAINAYEDKDGAMSAYFSELAYAYSAKIDTTCMVVDEYGGVLRSERYTTEPENVEGD